MIHELEASTLFCPEGHMLRPVWGEEAFLHCPQGCTLEEATA